jgi:hypothetical protein
MSVVAINVVELARYDSRRHAHPEVHLLNLLHHLPGKSPIVWGRMGTELD